MPRNKLGENYRDEIEDARALFARSLYFHHDGFVRLVEKEGRPQLSLFWATQYNLKSTMENTLERQDD